ncbi:MAG: hypothetical protein NZ888_06285 [Candidatus Nitrosocaldus sp.]|nr:hypothetical protein [Candidatus Nitrosocaldus sp.]MDW8000452.1 hypothetical protein [Candidatus Nitrosocaldus sp.]
MEALRDEVRRVADRLNLSVHIVMDEENSIIKVYADADMLRRAKAGMRDVLELAYTTAEHHPYWGIAYNAAEILNILLERWDGSSDLSRDEIDELEWRASELKNAIEKLK